MEQIRKLYYQLLNESDSFKKYVENHKGIPTDMLLKSNINGINNLAKNVADFYDKLS